MTTTAGHRQLARNAGFGRALEAARGVRRAAMIATSVACLAAAAVAEPVEKPAAGAAEAGPALTMDQFLDRVMMAESGGRADLRARRSTAVGAYQLIEGTFLYVARRHFPEDIGRLPLPQQLALRLDPKVSRRIAEAFTKDNAAILASQGLPTSYPNLRLAYIVGPGGAVRVLKAHPDTPLARLLSPAALAANPFMSAMTARGMLAKAARDLSVDPSSNAGVDVTALTVAAKMKANGIAVRCNLTLPSCRRWVALHERMAPAARVASTKAVAAPMRVASRSPVLPANRGPVRVRH